ncbi:hypothetical protein ACQEVB_00170 [Pseudonocardia sp. CA-107938]|uniref:hypothetical protein n=1 Tax=Pseudonocardia sp. CA-107938 TaxID=3240021 RepID=UPI003D8CF5F6
MAPTDRRADTHRVTRPSLGRAVMLIVGTWVAAAAFVVTVASDTRMGPVVYRFTATHGVHLGDVYATLACAIVAMLITVWIIVDHMGRKRRWAKAQKTAQRRAEREAAAAEEYEEYEAEDRPADQAYYDEYYDDYPDDQQYDDEYYEDEQPEPRHGRHAADPDLVETVYIERPDDRGGRHHQWS